MHTKDQSTNRDTASSNQEGAPFAGEHDHSVDYDQTQPTPVRQAQRAHQSLTQGDILHLQRKIGNRSVQKLLTPNAGSAVIQREIKAVGFDRVGTGKHGDVLITSDLVNCIAVAAQDAGSRTAVMGHLQTGIIEFANEAHYVAFRELLLNELQQAVGHTVNPVYHVSLGSYWMSNGRDAEDPTNNKWFEMRHAIIGNCINVFRSEPIAAGKTAEFDTRSNTIRGSETVRATEPPIAALPHGWESAGESIPYDDIKGKDQNKWMLKKNRPTALKTLGKMFWG